MLVLDENLPAGQRLSLRKWRFHFRTIGIEVAPFGTADENLLPALRRLAQPTFFSLDRDFHRPTWAHSGYGLVWLDVTDEQAARFIRRFLKHPQFDTQAKRMGTVVRVHKEGVQRWSIGRHTPESFAWPDE